MKRLTLIRHAKSSWKHPELDDHERPLNKRGRRDAPEMGARLARRAERFDLLLSSTARRARDTADAIAEALGAGAGRQAASADLYHADAEDLLAELRGLDPALERVALVGHNPALTDLANRLAGTSLVKLPTAAVFTVELPVDDWSAVAPGSGRLVDYDYPKREPDPRQGT